MAAKIIAICNQKGSFQVIVKGKLENKSVLFGLSHSGKKQDYYVAPKLMKLFDGYECFDIAVPKGNAGKIQISKSRVVLAKGEKMTLT